MLPGDKYLLRHNDHHMLPREGMYRSRGLLPMMDSTSEVMGIGLGVARLLLSAVFLIACGAKLADPTGGRQALIGFGVPQVLTPALSAALPIAELAVALSLIPVASAWFAAIGALALLLLFVIAIAANLALGRTPDCHCFGQLHSAPAGWSTLVRNAGLALIAGFIVFRGWENPGASVVGWLSDLTTAQRVGVVGGLAILVLLGAEGALLFQILRQQGRILLRIEALQRSEPRSVAGAPAVPAMGRSVGARAPSFRLNEISGQIIALENLTAAGKQVLLFFTNPNCGPCQALMPDIGRWQRDHAAVLTVAVVTEGTAEDNGAKSAQRGLSHVLLQQKREIAEIYQAWGTPAAVLIRPDGTIGSPVAQGAEAIRALVTQAIGVAPRLLPAAGTADVANRQSESGKPSPAVKVGDRAPLLGFHDLDGKTVSMKDFHGRQTLLLFWNPACGFCQKMLEALRVWEANASPSAVNLILISTGTVQVNRAMNLRSTIVLDQNFQAGSAFGANGTPMAVLLDGKGRLASNVVAGAEPIFALISGQSVESRAVGASRMD
ncbi:MAG: TlpA disulfide reductase family protein [Roseiarcus sp.]